MLLYRCTGSQEKAQMAQLTNEFSSVLYLTRKGSKDTQTGVTYLEPIKYRPLLSKQYCTGRYHPIQGLQFNTYAIYIGLASR